jgi:hypothetical protein
MFMGGVKLEGGDGGFYLKIQRIRVGWIDCRMKNVEIDSTLDSFSDLSSVCI